MTVVSPIGRKHTGCGSMFKEHKLQLHDLTEAEWRLVRELIPMAGSTKEPKLGVIRAYVNGILWRMRTGQNWNQVPREYGNHKSVYSKFVRWRQSGVWQNVTTTLAHARDGKVPRLSREFPLVGGDDVPQGGERKASSAS
jgi:transposase